MNMTHNMPIHAHIYSIIGMSAANRDLAAQVPPYRRCKLVVSCLQTALCIPQLLLQSCYFPAHCVHRITTTGAHGNDDKLVTGGTIHNTS